ncbi:class I SAM-dependent methyltransferase [Bacillus haynesii]|uniref:class I SAM-dependent methyltransferase n=3 Tax=Bacillus haynesii TaxID=1925021 RepID=UPI0015F5FC65|nr:class I SAM-dependent methyltransferase [Bacillus haynesii]UIN44445.1 class I SAM-dependent methyltransferase [Bacillus licheniformis]MCY7835720.1 class I SAM-dependent methyltransferase [Bacillus haynesii]MCY7845792.1 class I SAM-dependent methyltransferase [Bacillus haynesii]MCY8015922.1 class I SAM-dependent methyltransferase [Bacillus haynesii]MCY8378570.1 class I SAM-dependent methyltransferase [Bacillus haynesii]
MIVTTSYRPTESTILTAEKISQTLGARFSERRKRPIRQIRQTEQDDVLVVGKERFELYHSEGEKFFFHPNSAMFRAKRMLKGEPDPFVEAAQVEPGDKLLDCTLGLGSDAIIASLAAGEQGEVRGIEKSQLLAFLVEAGLQSWETGLDALDQAMKRIRVHSGDSIDYLLELDDDSADIVYFDPMFDDGIKESDGIAPLRKWAHSEFTLDGALHEALRVAKKRVVLKDHWKSPRFEKYGFRVKKRKTALFHYGVLEK